MFFTILGITTGIVSNVFVSSLFEVFRFDPVNSLVVSLIILGGVGFIFVGIFKKASKAREDMQNTIKAIDHMKKDSSKK